jgi:hypothetical protein
MCYNDSFENGWLWSPIFNINISLILIGKLRTKLGEQFMLNSSIKLQRKPALSVGFRYIGGLSIGLVPPVFGSNYFPLLFLQQYGICPAYMV